MKAFFVDSAASDNSKFIIMLSEEFHQNYPNLVCRNSYGVFMARLMDLSYPDFLRYSFEHGGEIRGKDGFLHIVYNNKEDAFAICNDLNREWEIVSNVIENEIWRKHYEK